MRAPALALLAAPTLGALLALAPAPARAAADVEFYATVNQPQVELGDTVTWEIVLGGSVGQDASIELPVMSDWEQVSKSRSSSTQINLGGGGSQINHQTKLSVILAPQRTGTLPILPARVRIGGKEYETASLSVKVLPAGSGPAKRHPPTQPDPDPFTQFFGGNPFAGMPGMQPGQDPFAQMLGEGGPPKDNDLFVRASLDKKQAYLGEQVTLSMYLFARVDIAEVKDLKIPKLDAFWAEEIESPNQLQGEVRQVNGVPYRVFLLRRRALFPIKAGKLTVEPTEVDVVTGLSMFGQGHKSHRASQPLELEVLPLPPGAPPGFDSTNVGNWKLTLTTNPGSNGIIKTAVGNPVTLDLVIEGQGSFKNLALPKMPVVPGLHAFDPTTTDKAQVKNGRFGGRRTLEYLVAPERTGSFEVPPITLSYFNPDTKAYETARTNPLRVDVEAGAGGAGATAGLNAVGQPAQISVLSNSGQLKPIHTLTDSHRMNFVGEPLHRRGFFLPLLAMPFGLYFLLAAGGAVRQRAYRDDPAKRVRTAQSRARRRFKGAEALLENGDAAAYYGTVAKALHDYLSDKLGCSAAGLTRDDLGLRLRAAGASEPSVDQVSAVLAACDLGRFAPGAQDARRKVLEDGAAAVESLEAQKLRRSPPPEARA